MKRVLATILILIYHVGFSWGKLGHEMVADIAKAYCSKSVQDSVNKYLGGMSWADAANWMDDVRSDKSYDYMKPWHYINIEKDKTRVETLHANIEKPNSIIDALSKILAEDFKKPIELTPASFKTDILMLFHLVGDLHQPLHVGYGEDRGGNTIEVGYQDRTVNLHHLWDTDLIKAHLKEIQSELTQYCKTTSKTEVAKILNINLTEWLNEGRDELSQVYNYTKETISKEYEAKAVNIIEKQIYRAGVRLADILTTTFSQ